MSDNTQNNRIARNSIFMSIRMVIVMLITFYTTRKVLQMLGVQDYGIYNVVCGFVSMFAFLNTSLANGIQRFYNYELGKNGITGANKVFNTAVIIQFILAILIVILAETVGLWYIYHYMVIPGDRFVAGFWIFQSSILSFVFVIIQAPYIAAVMSHERMDYYAIISIIDALLKLLIVFIIPLLEGDILILYGFFVALISIFNFLSYLLYSKCHFEEVKINFVFEKQLFKEMLGFSGWNFFGSFANMMKEQGVNLVLNLSFGPIVNAARGIAVQVNSGIQGFVQNLSVPVRPQIVQSYAVGNISRTMNLTYSVSKLSCIFLYIISLPVLVDIDFVLSVWLGDEVPDHTDTFVYIIIMVSFINNLNASISNVVHATGKMKLYQLTGAATILSAIPLSYIAIEISGSPELGLFMTFVSMFFAQIIAMLVLKRIVDYSIIYYLKKVVLPLLVVMLFTFWIPFVIRNLMEAGVLRLIVITTICFLTVGSFSYIYALEKVEKELMNSLLLRVIHR